VSAALATPPAHARAPRAAAEPTLADVLGAAWASVSTGAATECPVCAGSLEPRWSAGAGVVGGRCGDCGATLE
jgi:hypothetical protein